MVTGILQYISKHKLWPLIDVLIFVVITLGFHKLWWAVNDKIYAVNMFLDFANWLAGTIYSISAWLDANIFGMDIRLGENNYIYFNANNTAIYVNESCSGFKQMWQVLVLFLFFPGPWKTKLWYIPMGMLIMVLFNVIRIVALSFAMIHWPEHWDFIHMWLLRPVYYVIIFILWVIWVEKFGGVKRYFKTT